MAGAPDSRCRPGLPPRGPPAPRLSASRKPEELRGRSRGGLCLGLPGQASGNSGRGRGPSPTPRRTLAGNLAVSRRRGRTTHSHTHTHTHTPSRPPPQTQTQPPQPRQVKSRKPQVRETEKEGERERQQEDRTGFQSPGRHTLPPPLWVSTRPPQSTRPHRRPPTHSHAHSLPHSPSGLGAGAGSRLREPSRRGPLRPRLRGSLGVPTGDCQPQGTASSRGSPGPRLTPPPLRTGRSLRCVTVCARVSVSDGMPSPVPCPSPAFRLSVGRSVSPSVWLSLPGCACALVSVCLSASAAASALSPSWEPVSEPSSLSVSVSPDPRPAVPSCGPGLSRVGALAVALAAELAPAGCLTWRGCPRVCLCACPCGCTSLVCTLSKVLCLESGVGARGEGGPRWGEGAGLTSSGRRRWWLQVGLGTAQVPGRMGAQGHGWAAPRPTGGSEDRGPQRAPRPWAANALGRWARGWGRGGGPRAGWCLEGPRVGERQDLRAPHSTLPPTRPGRHTPAGCSRSREALWSPGPGRPSVGRGCLPGRVGGRVA